MRGNRTFKHMALAAAIVAAIPATGRAAAAADKLVELAAGDAAPQVRLKVDSSCKGDLAVFRLSNAGSAWPKTGTLGIYHVTSDGVEVITTRRIRLAEGQKASFRIHQKQAGYVGFYVNPSWYPRTPAWDALASCR